MRRQQLVVFVYLLPLRRVRPVSVLDVSVGPKEVVLELPVELLPELHQLSALRVHVPVKPRRGNSGNARGGLA